MEEYESVTAPANSIHGNPCVPRDVKDQANKKAMVKALEENFKQPDLWTFMIETGNKKRIEATFDKKWGISSTCTL